MQNYWWIIPVSILAFTVLGYIWFVSRAMPTTKDRNKDDDLSIQKILNLTNEQAERACEIVFKNKHLVETVTPVKSNIAEKQKLLDDLHLSISKLINNFGTIRIIESDSYIGLNELEYINNNSEIKIGGSKMDGYDLIVEIQSPIVKEVCDGNILETFPSIYHYILIVKGLD